MADVSRKRALDGDAAHRPYKKPKTSELPLEQSKRAAIDQLVHTFRKKGEFDSIRNAVRAQFEASPAKANLLESLADLVDRETDKNPSLLSRDPNMAAGLIEGAGERSDIYKAARDAIEEMVNNLIESQGRDKMREYRVAEVGEEVAAEEEQRGSKSEEEWAREAEQRRSEREAVREKEMEEERAREKEEKARKEERRRREREEDEARAKERQERAEKRRQEEEERRRLDRERIEREKEEEKQNREKEEAERAARLKRIREEDRERERKFEEERQRERERERERERDRDRDRDRRRDSRREHRRGSRARSRTPDRRRDRSRDRDDDRARTRRRSRTRSPEPIKDVKLEDVKVEVDDDLALKALLQETEEMKKSKSRGPFLSRRSVSLEPPLRKARPPKSLVPEDPIAARLAAIEGKSHSPATKLHTKAEDRSDASPALPTTPKDHGTPMEEGLILKSTESEAKSRWDRPPDSKHDKYRGRSRSRSIAPVSTDAPPSLRTIAAQNAMTTNVPPDPATTADAVAETTMTTGAPAGPEAPPEKHTPAAASPAVAPPPTTAAKTAQDLAPAPALAPVAPHEPAIARPPGAAAVPALAALTETEETTAGHPVVVADATTVATGTIAIARMTGDRAGTTETSAEKTTIGTMGIGRGGHACRSRIGTFLGGRPRGMTAAKSVNGVVIVIVIVGGGGGTEREVGVAPGVAPGAVRSGATMDEIAETEEGEIDDRSNSSNVGETGGGEVRFVTPFPSGMK
ncbi:hypothetical protein PSPO01_01609 [Paraphaeosphaeria sporulosa]